jgi:site-specific recombinase XerC
MSRSRNITAALYRSGTDAASPCPARVGVIGSRDRRHSFAVNYLRKSGSVFNLQEVLGHSSLEMTRRYANLMTEDL